MLNWIVGFCHKAAEIRVQGRTRLAPSEHRTRASVVGARCHNHHATSYYCVTNFIILSYYHSPGLTLDTLLFPAAAQEIFPCPITPWDSAESIYMIPTMGSSPSFFLHSLAIQFLPWPETHFTCLWLNKKAVPGPCYHLTVTQSSILFW